MSDTVATCGWDETDDGFWESECGNAFEFTEGYPENNKFKFCPYCGKLITATLFKEETNER